MGTLARDPEKILSIAGAALVGKVEEVHGVAQAGVGLQDVLNHKVEHDHTQVSVPG